MNDGTIDNQQEIVTQEEKAWLAGIIDGEGCIAMNVRQKQWNGWNGIGVDMKVLVTNTDSGINNRVFSLLSKLGINPYVVIGTSTKNRKEVKHTGTSRMKYILFLLKEVKPYLAGIKAQKADLLIRFIERRNNRQTARSKGGPTWYDAEDWSLVQAFYDLDGKNLQKILRDYTRTQLKAA